MKATDILRAYRQAARACGQRPTAWLKLLLVASHGDKGCHGAKLWRQALDTRTVKRWESLGLVVAYKVPTKARPQTWLKITPHGLDTLQLTP